jgi:solute carrier family 25 (mitochondrial folate transporter), member 32
VSIGRSEGLRGLYRGLLPSLLGVSHGAVQFVTYEELRRRAVQRWGGGDARALHDTHWLALGAASKFVALTCTYPVQVVRARMQTDLLLPRTPTAGPVAAAAAATNNAATGTGAGAGTGTGSGVSEKPRLKPVTYARVWQSAVRIARTEGAVGLFRGWVPTVLRVTPAACINFWVYERVSQWIRTAHAAGGGAGAAKQHAFG